MIICSYSNIDIIQGVNGYGDAEGITDWRIANTNTGILNILNSSSDNTRISINTNGNVGIGSKDPSTITDLLDVSGNINISGIYEINGRDVINDTSNYVLSTSNILVNRIVASASGGGGGTSQWTNVSSGIFYNTSNVGIGTSFVASKLHIYDTINTTTTLTIQNAFPYTPLITSSPSAITGTTGIYTYMIFTYTTETGGVGSRQTLYTLNVSAGGVVCDILMVGGGGAGGKDIGAGGGGGAVLYGTNITIPSGAYNIYVGNGGLVGEVRGKSTTGFGATLLGGGCAGNATWAAATTANSGGSGAGGKSSNSSASGGGGVGVSTKGTILTTATLYNGNIGGTGALQGSGVQSSGGGGAGAAGGNGNGNTSQTGNGGNGVLVNITGVNYYWGGGGGGGGYQSIPTNGGLGGGGAGERNDGNNVKTYGSVGESSYTTPVNMNGGEGTGGGGGGSGYTTATAGNGGSGIIIIRFIGTITSSSIELIKGSSSNGNIDYKIGNYGGEFKIKASVNNTDTDYIRITSAGASIYNPTGSPQWSTTSDRRIKENIEKASYDICYDNINKLDLYRFNYIKDFNNVNKDLRQLGFIAQEVQDIFPKAVSSQSFNNTDVSIPDLLSIDITQINYSLYGAVKKLIELSENKEDCLNKLIEMNEDKKKRIKRLKTLLNIDTSNISIDTSNLNSTSSNIQIDTSNLNTTSSNLSIDTSNLSIDTSNLSIDTSNLNSNTSNIEME